MQLNNQRIACLLSLLGILAVIFAPPAQAQDVGDLINQIAGESAESEAPPASAVDLLGQKSVLDKLQLNNDQRTKIDAIVGDFNKQVEELEKGYDDKLKAITSFGDKLRKRAEFKGEIRTKTEELKAKANESLLGLLNEQQQAELAKVSPVAAAASAESSSAGAIGDSADRRGTSKASRASSAPARRTADTVASFGAVDDRIAQVDAEEDETGAVPAVNPDEEPKTAAAAGPAAEPQLLSFNFVEAPWTDVLRLFAESAGLTLNLRDVPSGSFTYFDKRQYTPTAALDVMNRMLMQNGFILVRHDRFLSVFDANKGIPPNLVETVSADELQGRGETELLRVALPLGDREAGKAAEEVRALLGPQGKVAPLESANSIVVTDVAANLLRVQELLQPPPKVGEKELTFKAFPLTRIDASEAAEIIRSLLGAQAGVKNVSAGQAESSGGSSRRSRRGGFDRREMMRRMFGGGDSSGGSNSAAASQPGANPEARVAVDVRTNSVLVNATAANMKLVEQMVEAIDVEPSEADGIAGGRNSREPYLEVYKLKTADATEVAKTLGVLHPGMVVNEDGKNRLLHIWANAEKHQEIAAHVRQLDGATAGDALAVLPLNGLSGFDVQTTVAGLYENDPESAPAVQFDPSGRSLIVRGDAGQIQLVQTMISRLENLGPYEPQDRVVRIVGSGAASSDYLKQTIGSLYPQVTFTGAAAAANDRSSQSRSSRDARSGRGSNDSGESDRDRWRRMIRERFFGRSSRGGDSSGSDSRSNGRRGSRGGRSSGRGR